MLIMATIQIFHSVLGVRPGLLEYAENLRRDGHTVHVPDLWDGSVYDSIEEGLVHRDQLGFPEMIIRAQNAADLLPVETVYLGYSLGALFAQLLAQTRAGARGVVLFHGIQPLENIGSPWPTGVPLQVHTMSDDPWVELNQVREIVDVVATAAHTELSLYEGNKHLFTDPDFSDYDDAAADLANERVRIFLKGIA